MDFTCSSPCRLLFSTLLVLFQVWGGSTKNKRIQSVSQTLGTPAAWRGRWAATTPPAGCRARAAPCRCSWRAWPRSPSSGWTKTKGALVLGLAVPCFYFLLRLLLLVLLLLLLLLLLPFLFLFCWRGVGRLFCMSQDFIGFGVLQLVTHLLRLYQVMLICVSFVSQV